MTTGSPWYADSRFANEYSLPDIAEAHQYRYPYVEEVFTRLCEFRASMKCAPSGTRTPNPRSKSPKRTVMFYVGRCRHPSFNAGFSRLASVVVSPAAIGCQVPLPIPVPVARAVPADGYGFHWSVYEWIDGEPARIDSIGDLTGFADGLAAFLVALPRLDPTGGRSRVGTN